MSYTMTVNTNDVFGFRAFRYSHYGVQTDCGYLFGARHKLSVYLEDGDFDTLAGADGSATLLRVSLAGRAGVLAVTVPDFNNAVNENIWPEHRPPVRPSVAVQVSGEAVLRRVSASPVRYEIVVGMLRCGCAALFDTLRDAPGLPSALASFWPSLPPKAGDLAYVFTPLGLALDGALDLQDTGRRDLLLLPRRSGADDDADVAWKATGERSGTRLWQRLDDPPGPAPVPNLAGLVERLRDDAPDPEAWPGAGSAWVALRWRIMTPESQPFLERCFRTDAAGIVLERGRVQPAAASAIHGELTGLLRVEKEGGKAVLRNAGMVCALAEGALVARLTWDARERGSVLTARSARAALWVSAEAALAPAARFDVVHISLRTSDAALDPHADIALDWKPGLGPASSRLELAPTGMLCGGAVAGSAGQDAPKEGPGWLVLERGCLQLGPGALPLDGSGDDGAAGTLLAQASGGTEAFRGGLPLAAVGGPAGLTAWVTPGDGQADPQVLLRIGRAGVQLRLFRTILVWRTGAWWACDGAKPGTQLRVPPLGQAFLDAFAAAPATRQQADLVLGQVLGRQLFPALWVGRAGVGAEQGWPLRVDNGKARFEMPGAASRQSVLWSAFDDAYFLQTVPAGAQALGGPLLDPARALVPLKSPNGEAVGLDLQPGRLPVLAQAYFPAPDRLRSGWVAQPGEWFHPMIGGLALEPHRAAYVFRHGPPMLADGYLRARLDGSYGATLAGGGLASARPDDDVAFEAPVDVPPGRAYVLQGWLPFPQTVRVSALALQPGGLDPQLAMEAAGGTDGSERLPLRLGAGSDGFTMPVSVVAQGDGSRFYLSAVPGQGKPLRNFGQSLAAFDAPARLADGAGRSWTLFGGGRRDLHQAAAAGDTAVSLLTQLRRGVLAAGAPGGAIELNLSLVDIDPDHRTAADSWDLSGPLMDGCGTAPMFGPFALHADALVSVGPNAAQVQARLGAPLGDDAPGPVAAGGSMLLDWTYDGDAWRLGLGAHATFEWRMAAGGTDAVALAAVRGTVSTEAGALAVTVTGVSLHTLIGEITLPCAPAPFAYTWNDAVCTAIGALVEVDGSAGVRARFMLACTLRANQLEPAGWRLVAAAPDPAPWLRWESRDRQTLSLAFGAGRPGLRFAHGGEEVELGLAQASRQRWLALAEDAGGLELAGCLESQNNEPGIDPTQLRLTYSWTRAVDGLETLFGPCAAGSWAREDGSAQWRSAKWMGGSDAPAQRVLHGHLVVENDYAFRFDAPAPAPAAAVTFHDTAHFYFDKLALDVHGAVPAGVLHAMVEHRFADASGTRPGFAFQLPQATSIERTQAGVTRMASLGAVFVCRATEGQAPQVVPQILYAPDPEELGACYGLPATQARLRGALLRLPFRAGHAPAVLVVPVDHLPQLDWFPVEAAAAEEREAVASCWAERRALAHALDVAAIANLTGAAAQAAPGAMQAMPANGERLREWGAINGLAGWLHTGLLRAGAGVHLVPYYAGAVKKSPRPPGSTGHRETAVPVTLFLPDPAHAGGLRQVARALVADSAGTVADGSIVNDAAPLLAWGGSELQRRALRSSALVMALGHPALSGVVERRFLAAGADDLEAPTPLLAAAANPGFAALTALMRPGEAPAPQRQVLTARTDADAVLEAVDAQPLVEGDESALRFRLALGHLVAPWAPLDEAPGAGAGLSRRQRLHFAAGAPAEAQRALLPLVAPPPANGGSTVSPALLEARLWTVRPGDTVHTRWALRTGGSASGPSVEVGLRAARGGNGPGASSPNLSMGEAARAMIDGVQWQLYRITASRRLDAVPPAIPGYGVELTAVTPGALNHRLMTFGAALQDADRLPLAVASDEEAPMVQYRLLEPMLTGIFPHLAGGDPMSGAAVAWAVAAGDIAIGAGAEVDPASLATVAQIGADARTLQEWNRGVATSVVQLGPWQMLQDAPGLAAQADAASYSMAAGADLARLLQLTRQARTASRHWLLRSGAGSARLALLVRVGGAYRCQAAWRIEWRADGSLDQPMRVLAVRDGQVLGFGDLAGPGTIGLEDDHFVLHQTALALAQAGDAGEPGVAACWLFGPGATCRAHATYTGGGSAPGD